MPDLIVMKIGGELLDDRTALEALAAAIAAIASARPLLIVHGGGREINSALATAGIDVRQVEGLRVTDDPTLDIVVSVLAAVNTRFVAALSAAGVPAVGLTGADAACGLCDRSGPHRTGDGRLVDLGRVGVPSPRADARLFTTLIDHAFVPVVACLGVGEDGRLLNVNADTLAGHLAARLGARRLVIAGTTPGVLDGRGATLPLLETHDVARLLAEGTATSGMIAKLRACDQALSAGVDDVVIVDGRDIAALASAAGDGNPVAGTRLVRMVAA